MHVSRRHFLGGTAVAALCSAPDRLSAEDNITLVDYHVHLDPVVTLEKALELSRERRVKFGIVEHAGATYNKYPGLLSTDDHLKAYLAKLDGKPVYKGIQAEGLDWMSCFSKRLVAQLDYVLSDAL